MKPENKRYEKSQKGRLNFALKKSKLIYGQWGIIANEPAILNGSQLSATIFALKRSLKKEGLPLLRVFPHTPVTKKPSEVRMGKGKGPVSHYVTKVQRGSIILEVRMLISSGASSSLALSSLNVAISKLPLSCSILS